MPTAYNDVDRLIFQRWDETRGLLEAYEELQDRIHDVISDVGERLAEWGRPQGYIIDTDAKAPTFYAYRTGWLNRRRDDALVYFSVTDFAPLGYRRVKENHPTIWINTDNLQMLRMKEPERVQFARNLRAAIGEAAAEWKHEDADEADYPLGKTFKEVADDDRVRLVADPDALFEFGKDSFVSAFVLSDAIDRILLDTKTKE